MLLILADQTLNLNFCVSLRLDETAFDGYYVAYGIRAVFTGGQSVRVFQSHDKELAAQALETITHAWKNGRMYMRTADLAVSKKGVVPI